jgi:hypothetical protein
MRTRRTSYCKKQNVADEGVINGDADDSITRRTCVTTHGAGQLFFLVSIFILNATCTVEPGYNDIGLYDASYIVSYILWYQLIPHC